MKNKNEFNELKKIFNEMLDLRQIAQNSVPLEQFIEAILNPFEFITYYFNLETYQIDVSRPDLPKLKIKNSHLIIHPIDHQYAKYIVKVFSNHYLKDDFKQIGDKAQQSAFPILYLNAHLSANGISFEQWNEFIISNLRGLAQKWLEIEGLPMEPDFWNPIAPLSPVITTFISRDLLEAIPDSLWMLLISDKSYFVLQRFYNGDKNRLGKGAKMVCLLDNIINVVYESNFNGFLVESEGKKLKETIAALNLIGAKKLALLFENVIREVSKLIQANFKIKSSNIDDYKLIREYYDLEAKEYYLDKEEILLEDEEIEFDLENYFCEFKEIERNQGENINDLMATYIRSHMDEFVDEKISYK